MSCNEIHCPFPVVRCPAPSYSGSFSCTGGTSYLYGASCSFDCSALGYDLIGQSTVTCLSSGSWSNSIPSCQRMNLLILRFNIFFFIFRRDMLSINNKLTSFNNYFIYSYYERTCSYRAAFVVGVNCGDPGGLTNGVSDFPGTRYEDMVTYTCNAGYNITGDINRRCQATGLWSGSRPFCWCKMVYFLWCKIIF